MMLRCCDATACYTLRSARWGQQSLSAQTSYTLKFAKFVKTDRFVCSSRQLGAKSLVLD